MDLGAVALPGIASMRWTVVADTILSIMIQDLEIPQICMQVHENYLTVQAAKTLQRAIYP